MDTEGLNVLRTSLSCDSLPNYHIVSDEISLYRTILNILDISKVKVLQVGIDTGRQLAYVVLCDNILLKANYAKNVRELATFIRILEEGLKPARVVIKVGGPSGLSELYSVLMKFIPSRYELYLVDERNSSSRPQVNLYGLRKGFTRDIYAALNIALREGIRIHI